jgi:hypothetical protein
MTWPQGPGDPYGQQQPGGDPYGQQPYSAQPYSSQPSYDAYGQPYQQASYQQASYQPYANPYQTPSTNGLAIAALICGIAGLFFVPVVGSIVAIILGHIAKRQIAERGESGDGMAMGGLVTGYIGAALWVLGCGGYFVIMFLVIGAGAASSSYDESLSLVQSIAALAC